MFYSNKNKTYLFILSPGACGSTLCHQILSSSENIAINNNLWEREGEQLPVVRDLIGEYWKDENKNRALDWRAIHTEWLKYWNPAKPVFLDKSIFTKFHSKWIEAEFDNAYFICLHRNPYAVLENYLRKINYQPKEKTIQHAIQLLKIQRWNILNLKNTYNLKYSNLANDPKSEMQKIRDWLPVIGEIKFKKKYKNQNYLNAKKLPIQNLNPEKIKRLSKEDLNLINNELEKEKDLMEFFNYEYIYT